MKNKLPDDAGQVSLPWAVVLTALTLALASAWLVFMRDWEPWKAFSVVGLTAFAIILALLAVLMIYAAPEDRAGLLRQVRQTCRDDLDLLLKYFRIGK